jgi:hypothetical protein
MSNNNYDEEIDKIYKNSINNDKNIYEKSRKKLYYKISDLYKESMQPNSNIVNNIWRINQDSINEFNNENKTIKKTYTNNIETMNNIEDNSNDSQFSDNYSIDSNLYKNKLNENISQQSDNYSNDSNINLKVINQQDKFLSDVVTNLSGQDYEKEQNKQQQNGNNVNYLKEQFGELKFDHNGMPNTIQNGKQMLNMFNDKMNYFPQSNFDPKSNGKYNVTNDMTHNNMMPSFSSKTYGYNPMLEKELGNFSTRKIELFSGSDQNPQFKHKQEVPYLFPMDTNKVESVTGLPNFNDFFESRYIPSDKRQSEKPFQPIRTTPGLNLGYNETGNTGKQDLFRVLPKTVDQLRTVTNPKVTYNTPIVPGLKYGKPGLIGKVIQKGPDRFYYNTKDSLLPQKGDHVAPAIYGKYIVDTTNREIDGSTVHLNPAETKVSKNTPEYLQGQFKNPFKITNEEPGPRNVQRDTRGQIINQETWTPDVTQRESVNYGDNYNGVIKGNKQQTFLTDYDATFDLTQRNINPEADITNLKGNHFEVPLINYLNYIPDTTRKEILLANNGTQNITNVSNSIKSYLFNSINSIPDQTLRDLIASKIILTNVKGNENKNYLFNNTNSIPDTNMRNLSENNLILTTLSNHEKGYLFNNINAIPDTTLRDIVNATWGSGGVGIKGNHNPGYIYNYKNAIPDTTMRELIENIQQIANVKGNNGQIKQYLYNYINSMPDTTLRELTEDKIVLTSLKPIQMRSYLLNYLNSVPDSTLREMTEDNKNLIGQKGNHNNDYMFNYEGGIPDTTMRELIEDLRQLTNVNGNHKATYLLNYINSIPETTLRELTENKKDLMNIKPLAMKEYLINYINATPDITLRELSENQKNIIGTKGNKISQTGFNYKNGVPDVTNRQMSENQKNIIGTKGNQHSEYIFNYKNGVPDVTNRQMSENQKNIIGTKGDGTELRTRLDYDNAILNVEKEVVAKGRKPVTVKDNKGPTTLFTEYMFCDDTASNRPVYSGTKPLGNIPNELYSFSNN